MLDARYAEQPRFLVEHRLDFLGGEPEVLKEIEDDAGIERARPRAHAQAIERGESKRAVDALPILHGAETGAASQVSDDHAPAGDLRRHLRQDRGDVLVRQAVEAVALHAGAADLAGQRHHFGDRRLTAMKARVEAGDLRHTGEPLGDRFDRREIVRLVERSERHQLAQFFQNLRRDDRGTGEVRPAVDDAMADTEHARAAVGRAKP